MKTAYLYRVSPLFVLIAIAAGCQGLLGVRHHDDLCKGCGIDEFSAAHGAAAGEFAAAEGPPEADAPHPKFHPLPTRPVFEPAGTPAVLPTDGIANVGTGVRRQSSMVASPADLAETSPTTAVRLASSLIESAEPEAPVVEKTAPEESRTSSRRSAKPPAVDATPVVEVDTAVVEVEAGFTEQNQPAALKESTGDMWRPRVANP